MRLHTAETVVDWLEQEGIEVVPWPAHSPDLNPIEHVRDTLKKSVALDMGRINSVADL